MTTYVKIVDGQPIVYPYSFDQLKGEYPNVSFSSRVTPEMLSSYGIRPVVILEAPEYDIITQRIVQDSLPTQVEEVWSLGWSVIDKTPPEIAVEQAAKTAMRILELKQLLRDTDYVALSDYDKSKPEVLSQRQAWREEIRTLEG